jgi:prepilin-type processing-associated H-X9-DG protein
MSNTVGMAEVKAFTNRVSGASGSSPGAAPPASPAAVTGYSLGTFSATSFTHVEWVDGKVHETGFTAAFTPNTRVPYSSGGVEYDVDYLSAAESKPEDTYAAVTARSFHTGGVNVMLMDGSVRFVRSSIVPGTWQSLATRAGGEVVGDF